MQPISMTDKNGWQNVYVPPSSYLQRLSFPCFSICNALFCLNESFITGYLTENQAIDKDVTGHVHPILLSKDGKIMIARESRIEYFQKLISDILANVLGYIPGATQVNKEVCRSTHLQCNSCYAHMDVSRSWPHQNRYPIEIHDRLYWRSHSWRPEWTL